MSNGGVGDGDIEIELVADCDNVGAPEALAIAEEMLSANSGLK
jgi:hypothetical protein